MAKFPDASSLGGIPQTDAARPVSGYDASAVEQGGERLGAGVEQLGAATGEVGDLQARYQFMTAHADYLAKSIALQSQFAHDQDYSTLTDRYTAAANTLRDQTAKSIDSPGLRERFMSSADEQTARGTAEMQNRATTLSNNADVASVQQRGATLANTFTAATTQQQRDQIIGTYGALVDSLAAKGAITPQAAFAEKQRWGHQVATADAITRINNGDAQGVLNELRTQPGSPDQIDNRIIQVESNGNPLAPSRTSHALGLGQFEPGTWLPLMRQAHPELASLPDDQLLALRADPTMAREGVRLLREQNTAYLQGKGVDATPGNIYLAHFLGPAGAAAIAKASPNMPAEQVLAQAVGPEKAAAMVRANTSVLQGKTAGTVAEWAAGKMGGVGPGGGHLYDLLNPEQRAELSTRAEAAVNKQQIDDRAAFQMRVANATSEALSSGAPSQPIGREEFIARYGADRGGVEFQKYDTAIVQGHAIAGLATMTPDERQRTVASLQPEQGDPDFALKERAYQVAQNADRALTTMAAKDPAGFAAAKLPASTAAYQAFAQRVADPTASPTERAAAAQGFAAATLMEQGRFGLTDDAQRVAPEAYVKNFSDAISGAATSTDPAARVALIGKVQSEAQMWGGYWPQVMRQLAPDAQPVVRAIAAGADPGAMTRLLSLDPKTKVADILKEQGGTREAELTSALNESFAPFKSSLVGRQLDRDYPGYFKMARDLGALYVRDGMDAPHAAAKAFTDLVGGRYDFRDTYRIPKSAGVSADDVQAGTVAASTRLSDFNVAPAIDDMGLGSANAADSLSKFGRDGKWVTSPDNSGLNLAYGDKFVRTTDGKPLELTWSQLATMGRDRAAEPAGVMGRPTT